MVCLNDCFNRSVTVCVCVCTHMGKHLEGYTQSVNSNLWVPNPEIAGDFYFLCLLNFLE